MKRVLSLVLMICLLSSFVAIMPVTASAATSGTCGDNLTWTLDDEGTLTISGEGAMTNWNSSSSVPWYSSRANITSVEIGDGVTTIGDHAFYDCGSLTSVTIPDSVTTIGSHAFYFCTSLTSVTIPDSVTTIGNDAFYRCDSLTSVTIPDSVTTIGDYAFSPCRSLTSITVSENNASYASDDFGVLYNKDKTKLIQYPIGNVRTEFTIPDSVTTIGDTAFFDHYSLTSVTIPDSVTTIGNYAFYNCYSLTSVTIPDSVTTIGYYAFHECDSLTSVTMGDSVTTIGRGAFYNCDSITDVYYGGSEGDWAKISIGTGNTCLTNATIHYYKPESGDDGNTEDANSGTTDSITSLPTEQLSLTVYENKNDSRKTEDSYRLAQNATVVNGVSERTTDKKGIAVIPNDESSLTIRKENYLTRTISAKRAEQAKKIYLQKDTGVRPIIQAVWIENTDVYSAEYPIDITSSDSVTLEAEVIWKSGSQSRIYLMQDAKRVEFSGTTLTTVLSDHFDVSETIYIVAEDTEGNATKKKLKFKAEGNVSDVLNDYKLSFGDSVKGTIPSSIPILGGSEVGLDVPMIPLTVTFEDNKFYAVLGLDVAKASKEYSFIGNVNGSTTSKYEKETKYLFENIKDGFQESADKYSFSKLKTKWKKAKYNYTAKTGFEADFTVIGYLEGYVDSDGKVSLLNGGVGINPSIGVSMGSQIMPVPPLYWEAELKGEIEAMLNVYLNETAKNFTPNGTVGGDVTLKGGVGLGVSGAIGISGGAEGNIGIDWDIYANEQDYVAVSGSIGAYVEAFAGPITLIDKSFPFAEGIIWDHPSTRVNMLSLAEEIDFYHMTEYSLIDRSYAEEGSYFAANDGGAMLYSFTPQNKVENTFKTNVYPYSEPQLAEFSDGTMLAVWLDDDMQRSAINRTALLYSYYDGVEWSEPQQIDNDGTGDYSPDLKVIDDVAYIAWVNANVQLNDDAQMNELFNVWEIAAAEFDRGDGAFQNIEAVTNGNYIDLSPKIFGDESGIRIAWIQNSSDDIFSESNTYAIMTSTASDGTWAEGTTYASGLMPIDSLDGYAYNGSTYIAYAVDLDGNQQDYADKEVYLNHTRLTDNELLDSKPVFKNGKLYYYSNGTVAEYDLSNDTTKTIVDSISTDRFSVISDGANSAIVYGQSDSLVTELYAVMYDSESEEWGESLALTRLGADISSYSGAFSQNGEMKFIVNKTEITGDINSENPYGQTDISLFTVAPSYNLAIGEVAYHEELLLSGNTLEFYTEIKNDGELTIDNYMVQVSDEDGNVLATTYSEEAILPGEAVDFTAYYPLGEDDFLPHHVTLAVVPEDVADFDESDNSAQLYLNYENVSLENLDYGIDSDGQAVIFGDIVNRGYGSVDTVTAYLYKDSLEGELVDSVTIDEELGTLDLAVASFTVPFEKDALYYVVLEQAGQNRDFVVLQDIQDDSDEEGPIRFNEDDNIITINSAQEISEAALIVALYEKGKLLEAKTSTIRISTGENAFDNLFADYKGADTMKIMVWDSLSSMQPLFNGCMVELK